MSREVLWTKIIMEEFIELGGLNPFEEQILRTRCAGWTITQQELAFHVSRSTINRTIKILKTKYDAVQKYSLILPPRKHSAQEEYMDSH